MNSSNVRVFWIIWCVSWACFWLLVGFFTLALGWLFVPFSLLAILLPIGVDKTPVSSGWPPPGGWAPGWYPDPTGISRFRWWDGRHWTEREQPSMQAPPVLPPQHGDAGYRQDGPTGKPQAPDNPAGPVPGWYPPTGRTDFECWWDGRQWTTAQRWWDGRQWNATEKPGRSPWVPPAPGGPTQR